MNKLQLLHENKERNKFVCLFNWLDTKLEITPAFKVIVLGKNSCKVMKILNLFAHR